MRVKKSKSNKLFRNDDIKPIKIDDHLLHNLCRLIVSDNRTIRPNTFRTIEEFMQSTDESLYQDINIANRYKFIMYGIDARIYKRIHEKSMIYFHIDRNLGTVSAESIVSYNDEITQDEIDYMMQTIEEILRHRLLFKEVDNIINAALEVKSYESYLECGASMNKFENVIQQYTDKSRKYQRDELSTEMFFLGKDFEENATNIYNKLTDPSRKLSCEIQAFNMMFNGGFECGRVYSFFGITGVGKSLTLSDLAIQIKNCNKNIKTKDPTKIPAIVILTMENSVSETVARLSTMTTFKDVSDYATADEWIKDMRKGGLKVDEDSPIEIITLYKPNKSVNTNYLYKLYDTLLDLGYEMILLIQDHLKRIKPINYSGDSRIDLGESVNDFKVFANEKDIPVLTNSHLNRVAVKLVEENITKEVTNKMGMSTVGESQLIMDNLDFGILINSEYDREGNKFLGVRLVKKRGKSNLEYFIHPYYEDNNIKLISDYNIDPLFRNSLYENSNMTEYNLDRKNNKGKLEDEYQNTLRNYVANPYDSNDIFTELYNNNKLLQQDTGDAQPTSPADMVNKMTKSDKPRIIYYEPEDEDSYENIIDEFGRFDDSRDNLGLVCPIRILPYRIT